MRILIIEDDDCIRETLHTYVEVFLLQTCHSAKTLDQAKTQMTLFDFDLILLDLLIEGEVCHTLIDEIVTTYPRCRLVVMSGYRHAQAYCDKVPLLHKPFGLEKLDEIIFKNVG